MSDLTERAYEIAYDRVSSRYLGGRTCRYITDIMVTALAEAGMLTDPDAEDPRITAAWALCNDHEATCAYHDNPNMRWAICVLSDRLRRILDYDPDTTGDDE